MGVCKNGLNRMHTVVPAAPGDIRHRLWTLYWLVRMTNENGVIVELGTRRGDSTRALLCACEDVGATLVSFDIEDVGAHVREINRALGVPDGHWRFRHGDSAEAALGWQLGPCDMVFIDTDHQFATTQREILAWRGHVRVGGCMVFHDYWLHDPPRDENAGHGVKMAVDAFADAHVGPWRLETHDAGPDGDTGLAILWRRK